MNHKELSSGTEASMASVLDAREQRYYIQQELLAGLEKDCTALISFTLNIAGPIKVFPYTIRTFEVGITQIRQILSSMGAVITAEKEIRENTGYEGFFAIRQKPGAALECKRLCTGLEEQHPLGRLFDIDVLRSDGTKVSRQELGFPERTCLLCDRPAFLCGRSRTHSAAELVAREIQIMRDFFVTCYAGHMGLLMQKALLYEVNTGLKPGLVDRFHNGAHKDMDYFDFLNSAQSLTPYFTKAARMGMEYALDLEDPENLPLLFERLRPEGMEAEIVMRKASGGANTHKGMIFSGGIFCCIFAYYQIRTSHLGKILPGTPYTQKDLAQIRPLLSALVRDLMKDYQDCRADREMSCGERLYHEKGILGIRGEALNGYPSLFDTGYPLFKKLLSLNYSWNDAGLIVLLHYMASAEDTNLFKRAGYEKAIRIRKELTDFLQHASYEEQLAILPELDAFFVRENISPGGSADMLSLTYFLSFTEEKSCTWGEIL